jgi:hypothetical protein
LVLALYLKRNSSFRLSAENAANSAAYFTIEIIVVVPIVGWWFKKVPLARNAAQYFYKMKQKLNCQLTRFTPKAICAKPFFEINTIEYRARIFAVIWMAR